MLGQEFTAMRALKIAREWDERERPDAAARARKARLVAVRARTRSVLGPAVMGETFADRLVRGLDAAGVDSAALDVIAEALNNEKEDRHA